MPRVKSDSMKLVTLLVPPHLWERYQALAAEEDSNASASLRIHMREKVKRAERRKKAA